MIRAYRTSWEQGFLLLFSSYKPHKWGHDTKVSFAYARSEQNVSVNPLRADLVRQAVKTVRCRTLWRWPAYQRLTATAGTAQILPFS